MKTYPFPSAAFVVKNSFSRFSRFFDPRHFDTPSRRFALVALLTTLLTFATTGCQVLTYSSPSGERFTRSSLGADTSIQSLAIEVSDQGVRRVELRGYRNDSSQSLAAVTEAAVKAAVQAAKP